MNPSPRTESSDYMHWAKTLQAARFNLANSGVFALPRRELPLPLEELELSGASFYGWPALMAALSRHLSVPENCIVHSTGTSGANHLAMALLVRPGDDVLIESPTYELLVATAEHLGAQVRRFERPFARRFDIDPDALSRQLTPRTRLIVLTHLHNPSSAAVSDATLRRVAELAQSVGAHVLVDEVYLDALALAEASGNPPVRRTTFGLAENLLVTSSLTKVYGLSGLRCGWILARPELAQRLWRLNDLFGVIPAHAAERLSVMVLENFSRVVARAQPLLNRNRQLLNELILSRSDLETWPLAAGTVAFPRLRSGRITELCDLLRRKYETTVVPGHFFGLPDHFRVGIGAAEEVTKEGLHRLAQALDELR